MGAETVPKHLNPRGEVLLGVLPGVAVVLFALLFRSGALAIVPGLAFLALIASSVWSNRIVHWCALTLTFLIPVVIAAYFIPYVMRDEFLQARAELIWFQLVVAPWVALILAVIFGLAIAFTHRKLLLVPTIAWVLYFVYELKVRQDCGPPDVCNIRVDLLNIHPILAGLTIIGLVTFGLAWKRRAPYNNRGPRQELIEE